MSEPARVPIPGLDPHVGIARLVLPQGRELETFTRGLGRNRVALLAPEPLPVGERVRFELLLEAGDVTGTGRIERIHVEQCWSGEQERWVVIDFERLDAGATPRLVRALFRERLAEHRAELRPRPAPRTLPPAGGSGASARPPAVEPPKPKPRPKVSRYAAPDPPDRWRVR